MHRNIYNLFKYLLFCIYSFYFLGTGSDPNVPGTFDDNIKAFLHD